MIKYRREYHWKNILIYLATGFPAVALVAVLRFHAPFLLGVLALKLIADRVDAFMTKHGRPQYTDHKVEESDPTGVCAVCGRTYDLVDGKVPCHESSDAIRMINMHGAEFYEDGIPSCAGSDLEPTQR